MKRPTSSYNPTAYHFAKPFLGLFGIISIGTIGYMLIEKWSFLDSLFMAAETLTTVGFGFDPVPSTNGKIFTLVYMIFGVLLFLYFASEFAQHIFMANFDNRIKAKNMENKIKKLKNHFIVCGFGRTGQEVAAQLKKNKIDFVVVEKNETLEDSIKGLGVLYLIGDATEDETLERAGIATSKGLFCNLSDDVDNLYLTVSARNMKTDLQIITRCAKTTNEQKFKNAGASQIIMPYELSARRMVASVVKPMVVDFIDVVMHSNGAELELKLEQFCIRKGSSLHHQTILESKIKDKTGVVVVAIKRDNEFITNPSAHTILQEGDCLIAIGSNHELEKLHNIN